MPNFAKEPIGNTDYNFMVPNVWRINEEVMEGLCYNNITHSLRCTEALQIMLMCKEIKNIIIKTNFVNYNMAEINDYNPEDEDVPYGFFNLNHWKDQYGRSTDAELKQQCNLNFVVIKKGISILNKVDVNYKDQKNISLMLQENVHHKVRVYKSEDGQSYCVCSNVISQAMIRKVIGLIPKLFPYGEYNDLTTAAYTTALSKYTMDSPSDNDYAEWLDIVTNAVNGMEVIQKEKIKVLGTLLKNKNVKKLSNAQNDYNTAQNRINNYTQEIAAYYKRMDDASALIEFLKSDTGSDGTDLFQYLTTNKCIKNYSTDQNHLYLEIITPIEYFDPAIMKKYLENKRSLVWNKEKNCQGIAQLCEDLFLTSKYTIVCRSTMYLDLSEYRVHKITGGPLGDSNRYKRQPHIMQYNCWGNNEPVIIRLIRECNIIGAVEQVIAACKNMNMGDTTVLSSFMEDISDNKNSLWITDETGKQRSFKELYQTPNTTEPIQTTTEEEGW